MGQARFQPAEWLAHIISDFGEMNSRQVVAGLNPVDLVGIEEEDLSVHLDADPVLRAIELSDVLQERAQLRRYARWRRLLQPFLGAVQRLVEPHVIDGLEQIIERAELERGNRVIVEGGDEDDGWHLIGADFRDHVEAVQLRHLHIQENQIGLVLAYRRDRLQSVLAFAHHFDVRNVGEKREQSLACERFIIDYQHTERLFDHACTAVTSVPSILAPFGAADTRPSLNGMVIRTA